MLVIIISVFIFCFILERLFTGWKLPKVHSWYTRVVMVNIAQVLIVVLAGFTWEKWLSGHSILKLSQFMNPWLAGFAAYFVATFVFYWWHRYRHESDFLWTQFHQIHHSPQRLEVITSFYKHPHEMVFNSIMGSLIVYVILGLSVQAAAIYTLFTALGEFFYHTNVKTPHWVGYFFQRPEMHRIHHQYNYHKNNYGDFAIWDMIFGTYENPKTWSGRCGFDEEKELRLKDMLLLKNVHKIAIILLSLIFMLSPAKSYATDQNFSSWEQACDATKENIQQGDLIFLDIPNFIFRNIAISTKTWTSHVGIVFKNNSGDWIVSESKVPISKEIPLCEYLRSSSKFRFEVKRLGRNLSNEEVAIMKKKADSLLGKLYTFGFDFESKRMFCSKFAYLIFQAIGVEVGKIESFKQLQEQDLMASTKFWKIWFLGSIPMSRKTVTPASQLMDSKFFTVMKSGLEIGGEGGI